MILLAIDTSGPVAGVCVLRDGIVAAEGVSVSGHTHSESMLPMVEEALTRSGTDISDVDLFAAVTGPGSFTGVRIGVSLVKGMAYGAGKKCVGIDALEALASSQPFFDGLLCPIQDARAGQVYGSVFEGGFPPKRLCEDMAIKLEEYLEKAISLAGGRKLLFIGDGVKPCAEKIGALIGEQALFAPSHLCYLRPAAVAALAWEKREEAVDDLALMPVYLRPPQAERLRDRQMRAKV